MLHADAGARGSRAIVDAPHFLAEESLSPRSVSGARQSGGLAWMGELSGSAAAGGKLTFPLGTKVRFI